MPPHGAKDRKSGKPRAFYAANDRTGYSYARFSRNSHRSSRQSSNSGRRGSARLIPFGTQPRHPSMFSDRAVEGRRFWFGVPGLMGQSPMPVFGYFWAGQKYRPAQRSQRTASCVRQVYLSRVRCVRHILSTPPFFEKKGAVDGTKETLRGTGPPAPPVRCSGGLRSP